MRTGMEIGRRALKGQEFPAPKTERKSVSAAGFPLSPPSVLPPHPTQGDGRRNLASHLVANQSVV